MNLEEDNGFIENNNYKLISVNEGHAIMEADITNKSLNPHKTAHGGFIFGLADTTAGIAAHSFGRKAMTINANIEYLHAVTGKKISAEAKCIKNGKTISVFEVYIRDLDKDRDAAKATITYFYIDL